MRTKPDPNWRPPRADDVAHRLVTVARHERTCLLCGDAFVGDYCIRCGTNPPTVSTEAYLRPEEYRLI